MPPRCSAAPTQHRSYSASHQAPPFAPPLLTSSPPYLPPTLQVLYNQPGAGVGNVHLDGDHLFGELALALALALTPNPSPGPNPSPEP